MLPTSFDLRFNTYVYANQQYAQIQDGRWVLCMDFIAARIELLFGLPEILFPAHMGPWCTLLATTISTLISLPQEDTATLTKPKQQKQQ